jgi:hypothetical protein
MEFLLIPETKLEKQRERGNDLASKKTQTTFFLTVDINEEIPLDYIEKIKSMIIDGLDKFFMIEDKAGKPNLYLTGIYRHVRGNEQEKVNQKITWLAEDKECLHQIRQAETVFQK